MIATHFLKVSKFVLKIVHSISFMPEIMQSLGDVGGLCTNDTINVIFNFFLGMRVDSRV